MNKNRLMLTFLLVCLSGVLLSGCVSDQNTQELSIGDNLYTTAEDREEIIISTRTFVPAFVGENITEADSTYNYTEKEIDLDNTALILIDLWDYSNDTRLDENVQHKMIPLMDLARAHNMTLIHAPHGFVISQFCQPLPGELVTGEDNGLCFTDNFDGYLQAHDIDTLLYAGYRSNWCVLHRPTGIIKMSEKGYDVILIRDCSIAFETPETLEGEWAHKAAINMVEAQFGSTTTLDELESAFAKVR